MAPFIVSGDGIVCHGKRPLRSGGMFVVSSGRWFRHLGRAVSVGRDRVSAFVRVGQDWVSVDAPDLGLEVRPAALAEFPLSFPRAVLGSDGLPLFLGDFLVFPDDSEDGWNHGRVEGVEVAGGWVYVECLVVGGAYLNVRVEAAHGLSLES